MEEKTFKKFWTLSLILLVGIFVFDVSNFYMLEKIQNELKGPHLKNLILPYQGAKPPFYPIDHSRV
jgi:hypothetical protein